MAGLPRRDAWLLPLISLATVLILLGGAELAARAIWPEQVVNACRVTDAVSGYHYRPNCSSTTKAAEGPWVVNDYNSCGYRSAAACGPTPANSRRIAVIGSSLSEGYLVEYPNTIAARVGADLTAMCRFPVEVQNLGAIGSFGSPLVARLEEALRLKPNAILLVLAPFDLERGLDQQAMPGGEAPVAQSTSPLHEVFESVKASRAAEIAQHFLFRNASVYLPLYLRYGDKADFLRQPFSHAWLERLELLDRLIGQLMERASAAHVPLMVSFVPQEAQVTLMAGQSIPAGIDPAALPAAIKAIALAHGASFADTSVALRAEPNPGQLYYQVDGHLSGDGQPIAAAYIAKGLADSGTGSFAGCRQPRPTQVSR